MSENVSLFEFVQHFQLECEKYRKEVKVCIKKVNGYESLLLIHKQDVNRFLKMIETKLFLIAQTENEFIKEADELRGMQERLKKFMRESEEKNE